MTFWILAANVLLAAYNTGSMWTLQLMHYPLYAAIGAGEFRAYVASNNRRAILPAIVPGVSLVILSIALAATAPANLRVAAIAEAIANLGVMASTGRWQGRLHAALARDGSSAERIHLLVQTNWIRTALYTVVAALPLPTRYSLLANGQNHGN